MPCNHWPAWRYITLKTVHITWTESSSSPAHTPCKQIKIIFHLLSNVSIENKHLWSLAQLSSLQWEASSCHNLNLPVAPCQCACRTQWELARSMTIKQACSRNLSGLYILDALHHLAAQHRLSWSQQTHVPAQGKTKEPSSSFNLGGLSQKCILNTTRISTTQKTCRAAGTMMYLCFHCRMPERKQRTSRLHYISFTLTLMCTLGKVLGCGNFEVFELLHQYFLYFSTGRFWDDPFHYSTNLDVEPLKKWMHCLMTTHYRRNIWFFIHTIISQNNQ